jgi:hypothetical protein
MDGGGPKLQGDRIDLRGARVVFASATSATLTKASTTILDDIVHLLQKDADRAVRIRVEVHVALGTDSTDVRAIARQRRRDATLSQRRAVAIADYFLSRGVARARIQAVGLGSSRPIAQPAAAAENERILTQPHHAETWPLDPSAPHPHSRRILISGSGSETDVVRKCIESGVAERFVPKDHAHVELLPLLSQLMGRSVAAKMRVLIVNDSRAARRILRDWMKMFHVDEAADGDQGAALLAAGTYDLVLLDLPPPPPHFRLPPLLPTASTPIRSQQLRRHP